MSTPINKILADRPQNFTTAEQLQARTNIGAQASGDYVSSTTFTAYTATALSGLQADTGAISGVVSAISSTYIPQSSSGMFQPSGDYAYNSSVSSKQEKSAMSAYVPFSAISADSDSAITSINGSSVGKFTGVSAGDNLSGNGTSASPLGLNSSVTLHDPAFPYKDTYISAGTVRVSGEAYAGMQVYRDGSAYTNVNATGLQVQHTASGIGGNATASHYGETFSLCYNGGAYYLKEISADGEGIKARDLNTPNLQSTYGFGRTQFVDSNGASATLHTGGLLLSTTTGSGYGAYGRGAMELRERTGDQEYQAEYGHFHGTGIWYSHNNSDWDALSANWSSVSLKTWNGVASASSRLDASSLQIVDNSGVAHTVDSASIDRWNSGLWNESGNSLSTGFGGNQVTAASQFNVDAGNWACRRVKMGGIPDQDLYGFQSKPNGTGTAYMVNPAGAFVQYQPTYYARPFHEAGGGSVILGSSFYPTGLTADARLDFVNLCSAKTANIITDTFHGKTADIEPQISATMWYVASGHYWTDGTMDVPV